jgi:signal transduction histidine kinase
MFANYCEPQTFTKADVDVIRFFADLASITIMTSQLNAARLEARLESDAVLFKSLAAASHTLRSPLHSLLLNSGLVARGTYGELPARAAERVSELVGHAHTASRVTSNMLDIASLVETKKLKVVKGMKSLRDVVAMAVEHLKDEAEHHQIRIHRAIERDDPIEMEMDWFKIYAVIGNLLTNAFVAARKGEVFVTVAKRAAGTTEWARVAVADTGPGVPSDMKLFEGTFCRGANGVGIGLNISKEYVELHGGTIWHSRENDRTVFQFELPISMAS